MTIKVYANCDKVITEKDFLKKIEELAEEYDDNLDSFDAFLYNNYTLSDVWDMTEKEKVRVKKLFHEENIKEATEDISEEWIETILDV